MRTALWLLLLLLAASELRAQEPEEREPYRDPSLAGLRSLVVPGWGQHSNGEPDKGWLLAGTATVGWILAGRVIGISGGGNDARFERGIGWGLIGIAAAWGAYDAWSSAERLNRENGYDLTRHDTPTRVVLLRRRW